MEPPERHSRLYSDDSQQQITTYPDGTDHDVTTGADLSCTTITTEGTVIEIEAEVDPRWGTQSPLASKVTITSPDPNGPVTSASNTRNATLADPANPFTLLQLVDTQTVEGSTITRTYSDSNGKMIVTESSLGRSRTQVLDTLGREVKTQTLGLHPVQRAFDTQGRIGTIIEGPDDPNDPNYPERRITTLDYKQTADNQNGLLGSITDAAGRTVSFEYDDAGRITEGTLPDGRTISVGYDANGNVSSITPPGRPAHEFLYTPINLESEYIPPQTSPPLPEPRTLFSYDLDGRMTLITRPDGGTITYNYDLVNDTGQLVSKVLPSGQGQLGYTYHPATALNGAGLVETITAPDGGTLSYSYLGNLPFQESWGGTVSGSVERVYDNHRRVAAQSVNTVSPVTFGYDADGFMTGAGALTMSRDPQHGLLAGTTLGVISDSYVRNGFGEVEQYTVILSGEPVFAITYERDQVGRITRKTEDGGTPVDTYYQYDMAGRLYRVCDDEPCTSVRSEYQYDLNSNRIGGFNQVSGAITATYDDQDRLLTYNGATYTYTANGELASKTVGSDITTYDYDALGNLRQVVLHAEDPNEAQVIDYVIDGQNRRIGKKVDGTLVQGFLYESQLRPVAELDGSGNVVSRFVYGEKVNVPEYVVKGGTTYRIITDHLGSPRAVVDVATGALAQQIDYDEFGNIVYEVGAGFQPFGFAGGIYDPDTKLTRFGARDYDAQIGRWTTQDPIGFDGGDVNLYGYALANPVHFADPWGTNSVEELMLIWTQLVTIAAPGIALVINDLEIPHQIYAALACEEADLPTIIGLDLSAYLFVTIWARANLGWNNAIVLTAQTGFFAAAGANKQLNERKCPPWVVWSISPPAV